MRAGTAAGKGIRLPWNWSYRPSNVSAGNQTQVLCSSSELSQLLSHLCSPSVLFLNYIGTDSKKDVY